MALVGSSRALLSGGVSPQAARFLARTSGVDTLHRNAYINLINGLVEDGVWSLLDVLYIFATQSSANALLNLIGSSFNGTANGSPTFTANQGFTGVDASTTVYIDTGFNASIAGGKYAQNSAHVSTWQLNNITSSFPTMGVGDFGLSNNVTQIYPKFTADGNAYFRIDDGTPSGGSASSTAVGHFLSNRTGSAASQGYVNGALFSSPNATSSGLNNLNMAILALNVVTTGFSNGSSYQLSMASCGAGLNFTQASLFYSRLRTYMTAVGVS